jgi:putative acetyltransferase
VKVRPEQPGDETAIDAVQRAAFGESTMEAEIVEQLRADGDLVISLVAEDDDGSIVGHVALSKARVEDHHALGLGPIGVLPDRQDEGIGAALMHDALARARETDYTLVALLGHPAFYPRFGFAPAEATFGVTSAYDAPPEAWMALALPAYTPAVRGRFRYAPAFDAGGGT